MDDLLYIVYAIKEITHNKIRRFTKGITNEWT